MRGDYHTMARDRDKISIVEEAMEAFSQIGKTIYLFSLSKKKDITCFFRLSFQILLISIFF